MSRTGPSVLTTISRAGKQVVTGGVCGTGCSYSCCMYIGDGQDEVHDVPIYEWWLS
jgi:hypothetical protein